MKLKQCCIIATHFPCLTNGVKVISSRESLLKMLKSFLTTKSFISNFNSL